MRRHLVIAAVAVAVVGVVMSWPALEARAKRSGEVVRVERPRRSTRDRIRLCTILDANGQLTCLGNPPPPVGASIDLLEFQGPHRGRARVLTSEPYLDNRNPLAACNPDNIHLVTFEMEPQGAVAPSNVVFGVMGVAMVPGEARMIVDTSKLQTPLPQTNQQFLFGVDADGDGEADLLVSFSECTQSTVTPSGATANCIDYWRFDGGWTLAAQDVIYNCY